MVRATAASRRSHPAVLPGPRVPPFRPPRRLQRQRGQAGSRCAHVPAPWNRAYRVHRMRRTGGELASVAAAPHAGISCALSTTGTTSRADVARTARGVSPGADVVQLYTWKERSRSTELIHRARRRCAQSRRWRGCDRALHSGRSSVRSGAHPVGSLAPRRRCHAMVGLRTRDMAGHRNHAGSRHRGCSRARSEIHSHRPRVPRPAGGGQSGVARAIDLLRAQIECTMRLLGVALDALNSDHVTRRSAPRDL